MAGGITRGIWYLAMPAGSREPLEIAASASGQRNDHGYDTAAPAAIPVLRNERREILTSPSTSLRATHGVVRPSNHPSSMVVSATVPVLRLCAELPATLNRFCSHER